MSVWFKDKVTRVWKLAAQNKLFPSEPVGTIQAYGGDTAPAGYMLCNGQALTQAEYPDLYAVIGTKFGVGDGSEGSFNLPDLRGEFLRGAGTNSHSSQGSGGSVGTHQDATFVRDWYGLSSTSSLYWDHVTGEGLIDADKETPKKSSNSAYLPFSVASGQQAPTNYGGTVRPTNTSVNYIIKVIM